MGGAGRGDDMVRLDGAVGGKVLGEEGGERLAQLDVAAETVRVRQVLGPEQRVGITSAHSK